MDYLEYVKCVKFNEFSNNVARYSPENNFVRCIKIIMQDA